MTDSHTDGAPARTTAGWREHVRNLQFGTALWWIIAASVPLIFLAIFFGYPVAVMIGRGLTSDGHLSAAGFAEVFASRRTWRMIGYTIGFATAGTLASVLVGIPGAYVMYRTTFPGRRLLRTLTTIPFVLPSVVVGVAFKTLFSANGFLAFLHWGDSAIAIIAALVFFNYSVIVRTVGTLWERIDPAQHHVAQTLGAHPARIFATVTLPTLAPAIASGAGVVFMFCASSYGVMMILGGVRYGTIETEIWYQTSYLLNLPAASALAIVQIVFVAVVLGVSSILQQRNTQALSLTGTTQSHARWRLSRDWFASLVTAAVVAMMVLPILNVVTASLTVRAGGERRWGLDHYRTLLGLTDKSVTVPVATALTNTLVTAVQATVLAVVLGIGVALVISRRPRKRWLARTTRFVDGLFMLPLGVSAVTVGFGFLIALNRPPLDLRTSPILVPIAQALVALPLVVRVLAPILRAIPADHYHVAQTLGANGLRTLRTIDWAHLRTGLPIAIGFAFATSLGEFGATSFLARPDRPTLPVIIYRLISRPGDANFGAAMAAGVVLIVLTATVMVVLDRGGRKELTW